jgi:tRNA nucleotidyltransferase/poly(A) polymerase
MFQFAEVGGAVRDKFLGLNSKDVDFVAFLKDPEINSDAESTFNNLVQHLEKQEFKIFLVVPEFFTIRAQVPDKRCRFCFS